VGAGAILQCLLRAWTLPALCIEVVIIKLKHSFRRSGNRLLERGYVFLDAGWMIPWVLGLGL
jgi:hypothetical protein